jgi:hypothetical protein
VKALARIPAGDQLIVRDLPNFVKQGTLVLSLILSLTLIIQTFDLKNKSSFVKNMRIGKLFC